MFKLRQYIVFIIIFFLNSSIYLLGQEDLKYKDIFNALQTAKKEEIYPLLIAHQKKDPYFANTYYQLGLISEYWARNSDPLTEYEQVDNFIYNTINYFGLARYYLDEKQARRYREFFNKVKPAARKSEPGFKEIQGDIDEHLKNIGIYKTHVRQSYAYFTQCVSHYNKCIELFMDICGNQNMLKEIYLTANDSLLFQTKQLQINFDSAILYFDKYRLALDSFPLKNYRQRYLLKPIETYRLDGLTGSDFTHDTIQIWNYKEWVLNLNKILTTEIRDLRNRIDTVNQKLDEAISFYRNKPEWTGTGYHMPDVDPILKNKLVKIDFGSVVLDLINYKENLVKFLALGKDSLNTPADSIKQIPLLRKSRYYQDLVTKKFIVDSLLVEFTNSATTLNIKKYEKFFAQNLPSFDAIKNYSANQKMLNIASLDRAFENFKNYLLYQKGNKKTDNNLLWKKIVIPTKIAFAGQVDQILPDHYLTYVTKTDKSGNLFLGGSFVQAGKRPMAFVAYAEKAKTVSWLKTFDFSSNGLNYYNYTFNLELSGNGCYAVVSSISPGIDSVSVNNTLIRFDQKGNELLRQKNHPGSIIRWLLFDDINNNLYAAFQGKKIGLADVGPSELFFSSMDSIGNSLWNYLVTIDGRLSDITRMDDNWLIFCNASGFATGTKWTVIKDDKDQPSRGILSILINGSGRYIQTNQYKQCIPAEFEKLIKLNSETLNILALRNNEKTNPLSPGDNTGKLVYMLVDKKGTAYYVYY